MAARRAGCAGVKNVVICGAGFGGLEVASRLNRDDCNVTLIDRSDAFIFGFSKLEVMLGRRTAAEVKVSYGDIPFFRREEIVAIDPANRHVTTDAREYECDALVVALGAEYLPFDGHEYYSVAGAERLRDALPSVTRGEVAIGILGVPFKCPPAPFEGAFLLHDYFVSRGVRDDIRMKIVSPMPSPIPVSPTANEAILAGLDERGISYEFGHRISDEAREAADLFIGIPVHRVAQVVDESGLCENGTDGWAHVDPTNLRTPFEGVWALGDCADAPVPRAGVFAEAAAHVVAEDIAGTLDGRYLGQGQCYIEMGGGLVGKVDADFLSGPSPVAPLVGPTIEIAKEKEAFAAERRKRWFGRS